MWTDLDALCARLRGTTTREEALALVHLAPSSARPVSPAEHAAVDASGPRAVVAVCRPGPARPRPRPAQASLFRAPPRAHVPEDFRPVYAERGCSRGEGRVKAGERPELVPPSAPTPKGTT